jgi:uncharacterized 2Fe-2S/4Fe-4S cluster protein (DUF4445 family)
VQVRFLPSGQEVAVAAGTSILEAARLAGVEIFPGLCGGQGTCGKCQVRVVGPVSEPDPGELALLEHMADERRLACLTRVLGPEPVEVHLASRRVGNILLEGQGRPVALEPASRWQTIAVPPASLTEARADGTRLEEALGQQLAIPLPILQSLPGRIRQGPISVLTGYGHLWEIAADLGQKTYGVAVDLGTTTVAGYLWDLTNGVCLATSGVLNPQSMYAADVIGRIYYAQQEQDGLAQLTKAAQKAVNQLIGHLAEQAGIDRTEIVDVVMVGNTCMHHLFFGIDPYYLAQAPYVAAWQRSLTAPASEVDLQVYPQAQVTFLPNIAGFVGADTVGAMLAAELDIRPGTKLLVDLGTNGEIVLAAGDRFFACSTAAGPAFEGGQISCGMRADAGAIDHLRWEDGGLRYSVIGQGPPTGLCGSGLVDAIAMLLEIGALDASGRLLGPDEVPAAVRPHILSSPEGNQFTIVGDVRLTQKDVRQVQLAKGAISAGIAVLLGMAGIEAPDEVLLAGALGNNFHQDSARAIGLVPDIPALRGIGNAAGVGAQVALCSLTERRRAELLAARAKHVELATRADFNQAFMEAMFFPGNK